MPSIFSSKERGDAVRITISNRTIFRVLVMVALTMIGFAALKRAGHALMLVFTAVFLALALNSPVHWLSVHLPGKRKGSRVIATSVSFLVVVILLGAFLASIVPPLVKQTSNFVTAAPHLIEQVHDQDTQVGKIIRKIRVDEIPQFWSILRGDMNFVGPRPERPHFVSQLAQEIDYYEQRHLVAPGLTGWAQIKYPYGASIADAKKKLEYDLYYIKNQNLALDATIMFETIKTILSGRGT